VDAFDRIDPKSMPLCDYGFTVEERKKESIVNARRYCWPLLKMKGGRRLWRRSIGAWTGGGSGDGRLRRLFWGVTDALDYLWTLATLRILDGLAGPLPETPADQQRARDRERIERAFPKDF
jgi:hypothetical protein